MQESVKQERWKYLGGSDIGIILGISPFKTRFRLLQEKAQIVEAEEVDSPYIRYGVVMEDRIREYVSKKTQRKFVEGKHETEGDPIGVRCHTDGEDGNTILEIKTTSDIEKNLPIYECQLCFYMMNTQKNNGILACYLRPDDFSPDTFDAENYEEEIDEDRLFTKVYTLADFEVQGLTRKIDTEIMRFIADLKALKENPFLSEEDLLPAELMEVAEKVLSFEQRLAEIKAEEKYIEQQKENLFKAMVSANCKKWVTLNGTQITRVDPIATEHYTVDEFDEARFKTENAELYKKYLISKEKKKSGKKGYVMITLPKGKEK